MKQQDMKTEMMIEEFQNLYNFTYNSLQEEGEEPNSDFVYQMVIDEMWNSNEWTNQDFKELDDYYWSEFVK